MTKDKALYAFFSGFDIPAYPDNAVLNENGEPDVILPYLTYTPVFDAWGGEPVSLTVNLWYRTESEAIPNAKAQELSDVICGDGYIWLKRGSPWCQNLRDETDPFIKRRYINVTAEYLTFSGQLPEQHDGTEKTGGMGLQNQFHRSWHIAGKYPHGPGRR